MEESKKSNIIIGLLIAIFVVLIGAVLILAQVDFIHRSDFSTIAISKDGVKLQVCYTIKFKAPLIMPSEIRKDAERKMKIYGNMRIRGFCVQYDALALIKRDLNILQMEFDGKDIIGDIIRSLGIQGISDKLEKIKTVKIRTFKYYMFEEELHHKELPFLDTLENIISI
jgi:hypothetical protein